MIEILCTLTGVIGGIAVVASLFHYQGERAKFEAVPPQVESDKIRGIADQLQVISHRVAANVSAHSEKVETINVKLGDSGADEPERILSTIQEIMRANESMQGQLADAQKRIAQQSQMIEHASQQARTDALTGLANRRALDEFLGNCIASGLENETVGLLLMDIDHFKSFNDSFGHTTGDAVLASFARSISKCCGKECYAARFGGEEFAVILTGNTPDQLALKAAQIRHYISEQVISYEDLQLKITASAGLCILLPDETIGTAYERADEGLYQAKKAGRNCGFWLGGNAWARFPEVAGEEAANELTEGAGELSPVNFISNEKPTAIATTPEPVATADQDSDNPNEADSQSANPGDVSEILDLNTFLGRLEAYLDQLRRADLPAAALMVEAASLAKLSASEASASWEAVVALVQINLRGIDVVCLFRPYTLCVFMPGCSPESVIERAAKIQHGLYESREGWAAGECPDKLAISIAGITENEEAPHFLDRLENALEEAQDASEFEVVVHSGDSSHFQPV